MSTYSRDNPPTSAISEDEDLEGLFAAAGSPWFLPPGNQVQDAIREEADSIRASRLE